MPERRSPQPAERPRVTSRAAVLAVVICAVALSLAYPVREYIAQHRQIDQLQAQRRTTQAEILHLEQEQKRLSDPAYVRQLARDRLNMCMPGETCYVVIGVHSGTRGASTAGAALSPWYERLWHSVQQADRSGSG